MPLPRARALPVAPVRAGSPIRWGYDSRRNALPWLAAKSNGLCAPHRAWICGYVRTRLGHGNGILVVLADGSLSARLIPVRFGHCADQRVELEHHERLDQVSVNRVPHPAPASFYFQAATPACRESINLVLQIGSAFLAEEYRTLDPVRSELAGLLSLILRARRLTGPRRGACPRRN